MKRFFKARVKSYISVVSLIIAAVMLAPAIIALAAYSYYIPIVVYNNHTDTRDNLPVLVTLNNTQLAEMGYINSTGLDTDIQEGATSREFMVAGPRLGIFIPSILGYQSRIYNYRLGDSTGQSNFPVMVGSGGSITVDDDASLELGNNFTIEVSGFIDTTAGAEKRLVGKPAAFRIFVSPDVSGNITAEIVDVGAPDNETDGVIVGVDIVWSGANQRAGQRFNNFAGLITEVKFYLRTENGNPTGTGYGRVRNADTDAIIGVLGSVDIATINGIAWFTFPDDVEVLDPTDIRVSFEWDDGGDGGNNIGSGINTANTIAGFRTRFDDPNWTDTAANDRNKDIDFIPYTDFITVSAAGVSTEEHTVAVSHNTTMLSISIDGSVEDSVATGVAVSDNNKDWVVAENDSLLSMNYLKFSIDGTQQLWFEPNTMVMPTNLPDRSINGNTGTINWGSNPVGIEVAVGGLSPVTAYVSSIADDEEVKDFLPDTPTIEYIRGSLADDSAELKAMPQYEAVNRWAQAADMGTAVAYVILIWITALAMGVGGFVAVGSGWGFIGGFGFVGVLGMGTPVWPLFIPMLIIIIMVLGLYVWKAH